MIGQLFAVPEARIVIQSLFSSTCRQVHDKTRLNERGLSDISYGISGDVGISSQKSRRPRRIRRVVHLPTMSSAAQSSDETLQQSDNTTNPEIAPSQLLSWCLTKEFQSLQVAPLGFPLYGHRSTADHRTRGNGYKIPLPGCE